MRHAFNPDYGNPADDPTPPCAICGLDPEGEGDKACKCPECPTCGDSGCLKHMPTGELVARKQLLDYQAQEFHNEYAKRQQAAKVTCTVCGTVCVPDLRGEEPLWCGKCNKMLDNKGVPEPEPE